MNKNCTVEGEWTKKKNKNKKYFLSYFYDYFFICEFQSGNREK